MRKLQRQKTNVLSFLWKKTIVFFRRYYHVSEKMSITPEVFCRKCQSPRKYFSRSFLTPEVFFYPGFFSTPEDIFSRSFLTPEVLVPSFSTPEVFSKRFCILKIVVLPGLQWKCLYYFSKRVCNVWTSSLMIFNKKHAKIQSEIALETIENENFRRCAALSSKKPFKMNWFWYTKNAAKRRKKFRVFFKKFPGWEKNFLGESGFWKISGVKNFRGEKILDFTLVSSNVTTVQ